MPENDVQGGGQPVPDPRIAKYESDLAAANERAARAEQILADLEPMREDILALQDEENRELFKQARLGRKQFLDSQEEPPPKWFGKFSEKLDRIDERFSKADEERTRNEKAAEEQRRQEAKSWEGAARTFISDVNAKHKSVYLTGKRFANGDDEMTTLGLSMVTAIAALANKEKISFEEAYKREGWRFEQPGRDGKTPPASLPVDAGSPGIPAPASLTDDKNVVDFATEFERRMGAAS